MSGTLTAFFRLLSDPTVDKKSKETIGQIFIDIKKGGKEGISVKELFSRLFLLNILIGQGEHGIIVSTLYLGY